MALLIQTPDGARETAAAGGSNLLQLARETGLRLDSKCGGRGVCRGCTVHLVSGRFAIGNREVAVAPGDDPVEARSCQTSLVDAAAEIRVPARSLIEERAQIDADFTVIAGESRPRNRVLRITPVKPTLENSISDRDRVEEVLREELGTEFPIRFPAESLAHAAAALLDGDAIDVTVGMCNGTWVVIEVEAAGEAPARNLGLAVDIGTTTVVAALVDLDTGDVIDKASKYNQQIREAEDVGSRISAAETPEDVRHLQHLVVGETLNSLVAEIGERQSLPHAAIRRVSVAGNAVMTQLFLGISPKSIGILPFQPATRVFDDEAAGALGIDVHPRAVVDVSPTISGYVGGDITADVYVSHLLRNPEPTLLIDIGTNGEMVFAENGRLTACATAAGPAFEGFGILHGCRATVGAIERVTIKPDLSIKYRTVGNSPATGICGSGVIDFIGQAYLVGLLNEFGRFDIKRLKAAGLYTTLVSGKKDVAACIIAPGEKSATGEPIAMAETDIAEILKAKGAIYAGACCLLEAHDREWSDVDRVILAGGFARHIDLGNGIALGMLPDIPHDRFVVIGNGSLAGALVTMTEARAKETMATISTIPRTIELNLAPGFEDAYTDAIALPNMETDDFPTVMARRDAIADGGVNV